MKEVDKIQKNAPGKMATSKVELRKKLTPEQFHVTQEHEEGLQSSLLQG